MQVYSSPFKLGLGQVQTFVTTISRAYGQSRLGKARCAHFSYQALFSELDLAHRFESWCAINMMGWDCLHCIKKCKSAQTIYWRAIKGL